MPTSTPVRRRAAPRLAAGAALLLLAVAATWAAPAGVQRAGLRADARVRPPAPEHAGMLAVEQAVAPADGDVRRARRYARARPGRVAFAVVGSDGRLRCHACRRTYRSASVTKAMLLVAELRRQARRRLPPADATVLARMVRESDNEAADVVYARHGDPGLRRVARRAGMTRFAGAGTWAQAQITAADQARLFARIDRLLPRRHRAYGRRLLTTVVPWQTWGIPAAARPRWRTAFKGGWRPEGASFLVHQAARLERDGRVLGVAVLTDRNPSHATGVATIRGTATRLLGAR